MSVSNTGSRRNHLNGYQESSMHFLSFFYFAEMPAAPNGLYTACATCTWGKGAT